MGTKIHFYKKTTSPKCRKAPSLFYLWTQNGRAVLSHANCEEIPSHYKRQRLKNSKKKKRKRKRKVCKVGPHRKAKELRTVPLGEMRRQPSDSEWLFYHFFFLSYGRFVVLQKFARRFVVTSFSGFMATWEYVLCEGLTLNQWWCHLRSHGVLVMPENRGHRPQSRGQCPVPSAMTCVRCGFYLDPAGISSLSTLKAPWSMIFMYFYLKMYED